MDDKLVTVAKFRNEIQAQFARAKLEEAGIKAAVMGANAFNMLSSIPAVDSIELQVFESELERARQILDAEEDSN